MNPIRKILIIGVNYNSYDSVEKYITSIKNAIIHFGAAMSVRLVIVDNSTKKETITFIEQPKQILFEHIFTYDNLGYIGAIKYAINNLNIVPETYDFTVFSNVDVWIEKDFFYQLLQVNDSTLGIIAPSIYSFFESKDRNPKLLNRYSKSKLIFLKYLYKAPYLFFIYSKLAAKYSKSKASTSYQKEIYAAHGSFIILLSEYFRRGGNYSYPIFLFGEEIFFAEEANRVGLKVYYLNNIKVNDSDHVSTSKLSKRALAKLNLKAINYILKTYYKNV